MAGGRFARARFPAIIGCVLAEYCHIYVGQDRGAGAIWKLNRLSLPRPLRHLVHGPAEVMGTRRLDARLGDGLLARGAAGRGVEGRTRRS